MPSQEKTRQILKVCFKEFADKGLENTSMRDLAAACHFTPPSLYDYVKSKDDVVIDSANYYMKTLRGKFTENYKHLKPTLREEAESIFAILTKEKSNLRFIYQVLSSPKYGEKCKKLLNEAYMDYSKYSDMIAKYYNVPHEELEPVFLILISTVHDFCLCENEELVNKRLNYIYEKMEALGNERK